MADAPNSNEQYRAALDRCRTLFLKKHEDYGSSWQVMRLPSITDQLYIKARRIREIEDTGVNKVGDSVEGEYTALVNYSIIALILADLIKDGEDLMERAPFDGESLASAYDTHAEAAFELFKEKNHDYGEAWREMRVSSYCDLILAKLMRIKQIENNAGRTQVSEGVEGNYLDVLNYALFALIRLGE